MIPVETVSGEFNVENAVLIVITGLKEIDSFFSHEIHDSMLLC